MSDPTTEPSPRADAPAGIDGVAVIALHVHTDRRGRFVESYRHEWLPGTPPMVQSNHAVRQAGSIVGLHFHRHQADYWYLVAGHARAVLHDLRTGSPTEGATQVVDLTTAPTDDGGPVGLYIPPGVAHGFAALTDVSLTYLVDRTYDPTDELGLAWDDPAVAADWGLAAPVLSDRDQRNPRRADLTGSALPRYQVVQP